MAFNRGVEGAWKGGTPVGEAVGRTRAARDTCRPGYRSFATARANDLAPHAVHDKSLAIFQGPVWHLVALIECDLLTDGLRLGMIGLKVHDEGKRQDSKPVPDHCRIVSRRNFGGVADVIECAQRARRNDRCCTESRVDDSVAFEQIRYHDIESALFHRPAKYECVPTVDPYRVELLECLIQAIGCSEELPKIKFLHREAKCSKFDCLTLQPLGARRFAMVKCVDDNCCSQLTADQADELFWSGAHIEGRKVHAHSEVSGEFKVFWDCRRNGIHRRMGLARRPMPDTFPVWVAALNEFGDANNDQCRWDEHRLSAQRPEHTRTREGCDCSPEAVFRNPAFNYVVSHD